VVQPARIINQEVGPLRLQLLSLNTDRYLAQQERRKRKLKYTEGEVQRGELYAEPRIMLSENGARRLGKHPGDTLEIDTPTGRQKFEVRAIFVDYTSDQGLGFIDRRWFQEYWQDDLVDSMDLYLKDGVDVDQVVAEVKRRFGDDRALFITPASKLREEIRRVVTQSLAILKSTDFITLAVALLGVVGTMLAAVIDRIREIGVLRAVGATQRQVAVSVVAEAGFLGLASALTGLFLGVPMGLVFVRTVALASTGWHVDYSFPAAAAARVAITVVVTAALAGLLPGRRAARMDVTEALSYE
jgi:putative ABC transport system permease protein